MPSYWIPKKDVLFEEVIKGSRFVTYLAHTNGIEQAIRFVQTIKSKHTDARHNCWAFVAAAPHDSMSYGCSDDGEPAGTAGKPMLAQLVGANVGEITAVVARYFGGTKLGTGGLVKAYGGGVGNALRLLTTQEKVLTMHLSFSVAFEWQNIIERLCEEFQANILTRDYAENVRYSVACPVDNRSSFQARLIQSSKGSVAFHE